MKTGEKFTRGLVILFTLLGGGLRTAPGMRFSGRLCLIMALGGIAWMFLSRRAETGRKWKICQRIAGFCTASGLLLFLILEIKIIDCGNDDWTALPVDAVMILGAGVNGETPSPAMLSRLDAARLYLEEHPDVPVVLSGGMGPGERISEAEAMRRVLTAAGVDEKRLLLEDHSTSTAENFAFSKALLEESGLDTRTAELAFVTNDFHILRCRLIARRAGLRAIGVPAALPWWWLNVNYHIREAFALVKTALFD